MGRGGEVGGASGEFTVAVTAHSTEGRGDDEDAMQGLAVTMQ